jgi:hypothetical protein
VASVLIAESGIMYRADLAMTVRVSAGAPAHRIFRKKLALQLCLVPAMVFNSDAVPCPKTLSGRTFLLGFDRPCEPESSYGKTICSLKCQAIDVGC